MDIIEFFSKNSKNILLQSEFLKKPLLTNAVCIALI